MSRFGLGLVGGEPRVSSLTYIGNSQSQAAAHSYPSGIQAGDLLVWFDGAANLLASGIPPVVTPAGWTNVHTRTIDSNWRLTIRARVATGTESGTSVTGNDGDLGSGASGDRKIMLHFRGDVPIKGFNYGSGVDFTGVSASAVVAAGAALAPLLVLAGARTGNNTSSHPTMSPGTYTGFENFLGAKNTFGYVAQNSSPADVTVAFPGSNVTNPAGLAVYVAPY